jgi:hypothetical protein
MSKGKAKPTIGFALSIIGAVFILAAGGILIVTGRGFASLGFLSSSVLGILGIIWAILIIVFAFLGYSGRSRIYGILVLIFGIINAILGADRLFIGSLLSVIGGILIYIEK